MKTKTKKFLMLSCMFTLGGAVAVGGASLGLLNANATVGAFAINEGAAVRTDSPAGIRFETTIGGEEYEAYKAQGATFGTVVMPQAMLGENTLTLGMANSLNVEAKNWMVAQADDPLTTANERIMQYNAIIVGDYDEATNTYAGLPEELYGTKLVARSYVTVNGVTTYANGTAVRSIAQVASLALADKSADADYTEEEISFMHAITDYVATTGANAMGEVAINVAVAGATLKLPSECGAVYGVYALESGEEVAAENYTVDGNKITFTDAFVNELGDEEVSVKINAENACYSATVSFYGEVEDEGNLLDFNTNAFVNNVRNAGEDSQTEWLASYQGASGVLRMSNSGYARGYSFVSNYTVDELSAMAWDYIEYRVFIESATEGVWAYCSWSGDKSLGNLKVGQWLTIRIEKTDLTTLFNGKIGDFYGVFNKAGAGFKTFWGYGLGGNSNVYFDYVTLGSYAFQGVETFDNAKTASYVKTDVENEWLESYQGATGVVKGAFTGDSWTGIQFRLDTTAAALAAMDWEYFEFKITVDFSSSRTTWDGFGESGDYWSWTESNGWRTYRATKSSLVTRFGSIENFYKAITTGTGSNDTSRLFVLWNMALHGNFYFDYVRFVGFEGGFTFDSEAENSALKSGTSAVWKESVAGTVKNKTTETGVLQFNHATTRYAGIQLSYANTENLTVEDWDVIYIRIRILRGESAGGSYDETKDSGHGSEGSFQSGWQVAGKSVSADELGKTKSGSAVVGWSTIIITKAMLTAEGGTWAGDINAFWTAFTSENGAKIAAVDWIEAAGASGQGWYVQLDSVGLVKNV